MTTDIPTSTQKSALPRFEEVQELLSYDPESGEFRWRRRVGQRGVPGSLAGCVNPKGYRHIQVNGRGYASHRLAWLLSYQGWPNGWIDHINGDPGDNRLANLREADPGLNAQNQLKCRVTNPTGYPGVTRVVRRRIGVRFTAQIYIEGRRFYLGYYTHPVLAFLTYVMVKLRLGYWVPEGNYDY